MFTLVLDPSYQPLSTVSWTRAVTLLFEGKVEVVEEYPDKTIRSVSFEMKVPAVIRWLRPTKAKKRAIKFTRENVYARDNGHCQYCGHRVPRDEATYDHVVPRSQGGQTKWENVVICCTPCNQRKGCKTLASSGMRLLSQPVKPKKLPDTLRVTFEYRPGMPEIWKAWTASVSLRSAG